VAKYIERDIVLFGVDRSHPTEPVVDILVDQECDPHWHAAKDGAPSLGQLLDLFPTGFEFGSVIDDQDL
jgi:hypothetical protein